MMDLSHMDHQMEQQSSIMPESERMDLIAAAIEEMRPGVQLDGGDLELVSVEGNGSGCDSRAPASVVRSLAKPWVG
jgi:hypothetical protein